MIYFHYHFIIMHRLNGLDELETSKMLKNLKTLVASHLEIQLCKFYFKHSVKIPFVNMYFRHAVEIPCVYIVFQILYLYVLKFRNSDIFHMCILYLDIPRNSILFSRYSSLYIQFYIFRRNICLVYRIVDIP